MTFRGMVALLLMALLFACMEVGIVYQDNVIQEQRKLIKLQMQDSTDLAACRIAAARK